jgi:hypothetical protein
MRTATEHLLADIVKSAHGQPYDTVKDAVGNLLINMLRQKHGTLAAAEEELDDLVSRMKTVLRQEHYSADGKTRKNAIVLPSMKELAQTLN